MHNLHLVSVENILVEDDAFLCSKPNHTYLLVENITHRLGSLHKQLEFEEGLCLLIASSSGYNTLNSFYGPL